MTSEQSDVLPILTDDTQRGFDSAIRGYDRAQVDQFLARLEDQLRSVTAERDAAQARSGELAEQLSSVQAQIDSLRRQLRHANESVTAENVDAHVHQMVETAKSEAARIRRDAEAEAEHMRRSAVDLETRSRKAGEDEAERIIAEATQRHADADDLFRRRITEAERYKANVEAELDSRRAQTQADEDRLTTEAAARRERLDAEAAAERMRQDNEAKAARDLANEDFEITLRARRTAEAKAINDELAAAKLAAEKSVNDAQHQVSQLLADAQDQVRRLNALRDQSRIELGRLRDRLSAAIDGTDANPPSLGDGT